MSSRVSIVKSQDHAFGTLQALKLLEGQFPRHVEKVLIKPNFVSALNRFSGTHVDCVAGILRYLEENVGPKEVMISESPAVGSFEQALRNYEYGKLKAEFPNVELVDLGSLEYRDVELTDDDGNTFSVPVASVALDRSVLKISPVPPKTHDTVVVTLSVKNLVMGSIMRGYRRSMHRGYLAINRNIAKLFTMMGPCCGVVDGIDGMEGDGPVFGVSKKWGYVFASCNCVALDRLVSSAMGFNPDDVGYLYFLRDIAGEVSVVGEPPSSFATRFVPHTTYAEQLSWKEGLGKIGK